MAVHSGSATLSPWTFEQRQSFSEPQVEHLCVTEHPSPLPWPLCHLCQVELEVLDSEKADTRISFYVTKDSPEWKETRSFCGLGEANL